MKTAAPVLLLAALPLLSGAAAGQTELAFAVRDALQLDPRGSPEALRLERQRLLDLQLAQLVNQRLAEVRGIEGLVVACHDGLVELRGRSAGVEERERATELALTVTGVEGVNNSLLLPGEPAAVSVARNEAQEPQRQTAVEATAYPEAAVLEAWTEPFGFATRDGLAGRLVQVDAVDGVVRLRGEVNTERARNYASVAAQSVEGVKAVRNELLVFASTLEESRRLALLIQRQIEYDPLVQAVAPSVLVKVNDGIVRLEGRVLDASQRLRAEDLAAWQQGVFAVDNRLQIAEDLWVQPTSRGPVTLIRMR